MVKFLVVILTGILISCKPSITLNTELTPNKLQSNGMDNCITTDYKDSIVHKYNQCVITIIPNSEEVGEKIRIKSGCHSFVFDDDFHFLGIYGNWLIVDEGTGIERILSLIDLSTRTVIGSFDYQGGSDSLNFSNNLMYCYIDDIPENELKRKNVPDCSKNPDAKNYDGGGVLFELIIFDLKTKKITYTERFKCS